MKSHSDKDTLAEFDSIAPQRIDGKYFYLVPDDIMHKAKRIIAASFLNEVRK